MSLTQKSGKIGGFAKVSIAFKPLRVVLMLAATVCISPAAAQQKALTAPAYAEVDLAEGSTDLDVAYVPTPDGVVDEILKLGAVGPDDFLIDLGSGDGRIVIEAARKFGARGLGVDLNPKLIAVSKLKARQSGVTGKTDFLVQDIFSADVRQADIITMYLLPEVNLKLRAKLLNDLKAGTRIVSHNYHLGQWRPDKILLLNNIHEGDDSILYLWIVPAQVSGQWRWRLDLWGETQDFNLKLDQSYQDVSGTAGNQGLNWPVFDATLTGARINFCLATNIGNRIIRQTYTGTVTGKIMTGTVELSGAIDRKQLKWKAFRQDGTGAQ
ncbi:MAG: methyltransferase domain-containing protein [Desulfobacterales bacterium]|nr:methyltransferase domain-containing protein [Desulfobacterales bacterium]